MLTPRIWSAPIVATAMRARRERVLGHGGGLFVSGKGLENLRSLSVSYFAGMCGDADE